MTATTSTTAPALPANERAGYLRQPTLLGERIAFVADDDLWTVAASGGVARRLTAGLSEPSTPAFSPDGRWLAFVGRDEQHPEVYAMPPQGGQARRLTWLGTDVQVRGWTPAGEIVYVTTQGQPFFRNHHAFAVAPTGGPARALGLGQVNHIAFGEGGGSRSAATPTTRRAGSATAAVAPARSGSTPKAAAPSAVSASSPATSRRRCGSARGSTSSATAKASATSIRAARRQRRAPPHRPRRLLRAPGAERRSSASSTPAARDCGCSIRRPMRRASSRSRRRRTARRRRAASSPHAEHLESFRLHPHGHSLAIVARGQLFAMPLWEGAATRRIDDSAERAGGDGAAADPALPRACAAASGSPTARR